MGVMRSSGFVNVELHALSFFAKTVARASVGVDGGVARVRSVRFCCRRRFGSVLAFWAAAVGGALFSYSGGGGAIGVPLGYLFFDPLGFPIFPYSLGVSPKVHLGKSNSPMPRTFGFFGVFGLFGDPGGLPLGFPVAPLPFPGVL